MTSSGPQLQALAHGHARRAREVAPRELEDPGVESRRCRYLWSCLESWSWNVPEGAIVDELSRAYIGPRKDVYSHGANALMYLVAGVTNVIVNARYDEEPLLAESIRKTQALRDLLLNPVMIP